MVVGLALSKKVLRPKDQTLGNMALGTTLGGAAGFLTGEYIRGARVAKGKTEKDRLLREFRHNLETQDFSANSPGSDIDRLKQVVPDLYPNAKKRGTFGQRYRWELLQDPETRGTLDQRSMHLAKAQELKRTLDNNPNLTSDQIERVTASMNSSLAVAQRYGEDVKARNRKRFRIQRAMYKAFFGRE